MGTFAVVQHSGQPAFTVDACHLNLWSLSGLFGRRVFLWDVGLTLEAAGAGSDKEVSKIDLLLPFATEPDAFKDLSKEILDQDVARLIFGKSVSADASTKMVTFPADAKRQPLKVEPIFKATLDDDFQKDKWLRRANLSLWTVEFASPVKHGQKVYVRMRFRMRTQGRTWVWERSKRVALIDVRVADIREIIVPSEAGAKLEAVGERFVPLSRVHVFVIVPGSLLPRAIGQSLRYVRLFEGRVWEHYLGGRAVNLGSPEKLTIYQWRFPEEDGAAGTRSVPADPNKAGIAPAAPATVNTTNPFRAFLVASEEQVTRPLVNALLAAALALGGMVLLLQHPEYLRDAYGWVAATAAKYGHPLPVSLAGLAGIAVWVLKKLGPVRTGLDKAWKIFRDCEDWVFRMRGKLSR
jgi:hypothetical protein